ncbi:hypothetical protein [Kineosporia sp. A_224]|nr:hypothetical protein [Kineosporia sp. A_224]
MSDTTDTTDTTDTSAGSRAPSGDHPAAAGTQKRVNVEAATTPTSHSP